MNATPTIPAGGGGLRRENPSWRRRDGRTLSETLEAAQSAGLCLPAPFRKVLTPAAETIASLLGRLARAFAPRPGTRIGSAVRQIPTQGLVWLSLHLAWFVRPRFQWPADGQSAAEVLQRAQSLDADSIRALLADKDENR